ncbi:hypothetical protein FRC02_007663 [Tulasnella sp. 418]|nr:hypothetical protein FRC02_007663 [Tulasnella sp. 418]
MLACETVVSNFPSGKETGGSAEIVTTTVIVQDPSTIYTTPVYLRPLIVDPTPSETDIEALRHMRITCGWKVEAIPSWVIEVGNKTRLLWFIHLEPVEPKITAENKPIGMISLTLLDPRDNALANLVHPEQPGDRVEIASLFVYPEYRKRGIGASAISQLERIGKEIGAKWATMNTAAAGANMSLYKRMGYREFREREKRYPLKEILACGWTEEHCYAAFLEKQL